MQYLAIMGRVWLIVPALKAVVWVVRAAGPWVREKGAHAARFAAHVARFIVRLAAAAFETGLRPPLQGACFFFVWLVRVMIVDLIGRLLRTLVDLGCLVFGFPFRRILFWVLRYRLVRLLHDDNVPVLRVFGRQVW